VSRFASALLCSGLVGAIFTGMVVASWAAYVWGDGDGERAGFCTVVGVFAVPLLAGTLLVWRRKPSGLRLLRFGSVLFFLGLPHLVWVIRALDADPDYVAYMAGGPAGRWFPRRPG
jgi:Mn2+/Fe2+ NRAMP family transporter